MHTFSFSNFIDQLRKIDVAVWIPVINYDAVTQTIKLKQNLKSKAYDNVQLQT